MQISRTRYVTVCQQLLVTAVVLAMGLSAAGVLTLKIVAPETLPGGVPNGAPNGAPQPHPLVPDVESAVHRSDETYVDTAPVEPEVREVPARGVAPTVRDEVPALEEQAREEVGTAQQDAARPAEPAAPRVAVLTEPQPVHGFATVGVTWNHGVEVAEGSLDIAVRTRTGNADWSEWAPLEYHAEHAPDEASGDDVERARPGTDPLIVGDVDQVQMKVESADGTAPAGMRLAVIDPGKGNLAEEGPAIDTAAIPEAETDERDAPIEETGPSANAASALEDADLELSAMKTAPKPTIFSRAQWGADERIRESGNPGYGSIRAGFVHHTVNANSYTRAQVPGIIRSIYAYHVLSRGWRDIGYNFLVDRFGRIWEGRYGGVARPVIGAHTSGYNEVSFAASAIGNFEEVRPAQAVVDAYAKLYAWKLSLADLKAGETHVWVKNRYLNRINGHRDVGSTACPGRYLYARIADIRKGAAKVQAAAQTESSASRRPPGMVDPLTPPTASRVQPAGLEHPERESLARSAWPDLVTMDKAGNVGVLPTNGIVDYVERIPSTTKWTHLSQFAAVGDVTGDGKGDVLGRHGKTHDAWVFPGDGKGKISTRGIARTRGFRNATMILGAGDWNGDGRNDVLTRERPRRTLTVRLGSGNGRFSAPQPIADNWGYVRTTVVRDFNGDGHPDVVAQRGSDRALLFFAGTGSVEKGKALRKPRLLRKPGQLSGLTSWGDLTGDGKADILIRQYKTGSAYILAGNGKGGIRSRFGPFERTRGLTMLTMAPTANARRGDVVGREVRTGRLMVVRNNGRTNIGGKLNSKLALPQAQAAFNVGDWDGDGHADIITRQENGDRLVLRRGRGDGTFARGRSFGYGWGKVTTLAGLGDVTGDGKPDLVGAVDDGRVRVWPGKGVDGYEAPYWAPAKLGSYNQIGSWRWRPALPSPLFRSAGRTFVPAGGYPDTARASSTDPGLAQYDFVVGAGDANGDGQPDLFARSRNDGKLYLLPGKASGGFGTRMWVADGFAAYRSIG